MVLYLRFSAVSFQRDLPLGNCCPSLCVCERFLQNVTKSRPSSDQGAVFTAYKSQKTILESSTEQSLNCVDESSLPALI
jgi:hypothetical protein